MDNEWPHLPNPSFTFNSQKFAKIWDNDVIFGDFTSPGWNWDSLCPCIFAKCAPYKEVVIGRTPLWHSPHTKLKNLGFYPMELCPVVLCHVGFFRLPWLGWGYVQVCYFISGVLSSGVMSSWGFVLDFTKLFSINLSQSTDFSESAPFWVSYKWFFNAKLRIDRNPWRQPSGFLRSKTMKGNVIYWQSGS